MKILLPQSLLFLACWLLAAGCQKTETITLDQPVACFSSSVFDPFNGTAVTNTTALIDSSFRFINCSDSGSGISYHWNFGDGTTSTEKNPVHRYPRRGQYPVTLIVSRDDRAFDTLSKLHSVILGQQHVSFGETTNSRPVGIVENPDGSFLLLNNTGYSSNYQLILLDSLMAKTGMYSFPASHKYSSVNRCTDNNYILTGTTGNATYYNELVKLKADGTELWKKAGPSGDSYTWAAQTQDGGFAMVGTRPIAGPYGNTIYYAILVKTDNSGNTQWEKLLDNEGMTFNKEAVVESDGYVLAGVKRNAGSPCSDCDSLLILKVNTSGSVSWKTSVLWGLNTSNWWDTRIAKLDNGNYTVHNEYTRGIFFFSPTGVFLDRRVSNGQVNSITGTPDGNLILTQTEGGNGFNMRIIKMTPEGSVLWTASPDGRQLMTNGYSCCSSSRPATISRLKNGGVITTGYRVNNTSSGYNVYTVTLLLQLNDSGNPK